MTRGNSDDNSRNISTALGTAPNAAGPSSDADLPSKVLGAPAPAQVAHNSHPGTHAATTDRSHAELPAAAEDEGQSVALRHMSRQGWRSPLHGTAVAKVRSTALLSGPVKLHRLHQPTKAGLLPQVQSLLLKITSCLPAVMV